MENRFNKSRVKQTTKPVGSNPDILKRNDKIRKEYYILKEKGKTQQEAYNLLSKKHKLSPTTIETIVKK